MARTFGRDSSYLLTSQRKYALRAFLLGMSGLMVFLILYFGVFSEKEWRNWLFVVLFSIAPFVADRYKEFDKRSGQFQQGRRGEGTVLDALKKLPDDYAVFQDVTIAGKPWNIDFVVLGPTGLFTIEVKNHRGIIGYNGQRLTNHNRPFQEKNVLYQAMSEAMGIHQYLIEKSKLDVFVVPVIVFSNEKVRVRFGMKKIKGAYVIRKEWLLPLLQEGVGNPKLNFQLIEPALATLSS